MVNTVKAKPKKQCGKLRLTPPKKNVYTVEKQKSAVRSWASPVLMKWDYMLKFLISGCVNVESFV